MASSIPGIFEDNLKDAIISSRILVVGAGGIGCEVLKNLVLSGFKNIEIIDLDTIDVSNLNRQFLFHKQHVGKSKAMVARDSALQFNPDVNIKAYHDNITSTNYGVSFFKQFNVVLNALDNRAARNHVNRLCLAADVPLIESGTAGYEGQTELIKKSMTQCYECLPKAAQKSYPGCTIRNTPSEPIHCIVWSKHLFNQLFGEPDVDEEVSPDSEDPEAVGSAGEKALNNENSTVDRISTRIWAEECQYDPKKLFTKLFHDDIKYLLSMKDLWKKRTPPLPLEWENLCDTVPGSSSSKLDDPGLKDLKRWSIAECVNIFSESCRNLKNTLNSGKEGKHLIWDKDDKNAMNFVAACTNIRAHIFGIPQLSCFEIKSMAGNIIPAIATTNAIVAGIVVLHAFKVLESKFQNCQSVYLRLKPNHRNQLIVPEKFLIPPNPKCYVCAPQAEVTLKVNLNKLTVKELEEQVFKKTLCMVAPDVMVKATGNVIISSEEGETSHIHEKTLKEMNIFDGSVLSVDDFLQNYSLTVIIIDRVPEKDEAEFEVVGKVDMPASIIGNGDMKASGDSVHKVVEDDDDDCLEIVENESQSNGGEKRKSMNECDGKVVKKFKADDGVISLT